MSEGRVQQVEVDRGFLPLAAGMLLFVPILLLGNVIGPLLRYPQLGAAVLFPPYAALTAALVLSERRHWGWYIVVAAIAHTLASIPHWPLSWVLLADAANIVRALVAAVLLRWVFGGVPRLDGIRALIQFIGSAVLVAPAVGATIGAANLVWHGASPTYWRPWSLWFLSNALTALTMLPGLLAVAKLHRASGRKRIEPRRLVEALALAAALGVTCTGAFLLRVGTPGDLTWLLYAPSPLLVWAALRFGVGGASLALTAVTFAAIWGADRGTGPFVLHSTDDNVLSLQLFVMLTSLSVLCIAAIGGARRGAVDLYRALLASLQDQVAILDARGIVLEVNRSWQQFASEHCACPLDRVRAGEDYLAACLGAVEMWQRPEAPNDSEAMLRLLAGVQSVLAGTSRRFEMEYERGEGSREWHLVRVEALERPDGGVVVTRADVSARHQAEMEIEESRREVTHLARIGVLGQLTGALAHELRQPLSSILANAETAQRLLQREPLELDELNAILRDIVSEDRRAAQVIVGLRSMLKRGETRLRPVDPDTLVSAVLALARAELITRRVTVLAVVEPGLPELLADEVQVQQVLLNLILNASEAMHSTAVGDRTLLLTAAMSGANNVRLSISDRGTGIPTPLIERLFEPFVTTKPEGLGLGLSIARTIVSVHGGRIWAENNAGGGATIHCEFPAVPSGEHAPTETVPADASRT